MRVAYLNYKSLSQTLSEKVLAYVLVLAFCLFGG